MIKAIAVVLGLSAEDGTENFSYEIRNTTSELFNYLKTTMYNRTKMNFFLRAKTFYNFSSEVQRLVEEDEFISLYSFYGGNFHKCSNENLL